MIRDTCADASASATGRSTQRRCRVCTGGHDDGPGPGRTESAGDDDHAVRQVGGRGWWVAGALGVREEERARPRFPAARSDQRAPNRGRFAVPDSDGERRGERLVSPGGGGGRPNGPARTEGRTCLPPAASPAPRGRSTASGARCARPGGGSHTPHPPHAGHRGPSPRLAALNQA